LNFQERINIMRHHPLTIFWPAAPAPDIDEIRFSYAFCRKMSRRFCKMAYSDALWVDYTDFENLESLFPKADGHVLILVTEPEVVLSPRAIRLLHDLGQSGHEICGPVYNQSTFSNQTGTLRAAYVDMDSFLEISEIMGEKRNRDYLETDTLDTACVSFRLDFLKNLKTNNNLRSFLEDPAEQTPHSPVVARGALVHSGFLKAFSSERDDLVRLVPDSAVKHVLDVGCAMGGYGKTLKRLRPNIQVTGVELNPLMAKAAGHVYDDIINVPVEQARFSTQFDLINCGDILEHLTDPWAMLKRLHGLLRDTGNLVLSIPNAGHWSIARALLQGKFQYVPLGLLCVGHLRWFTESSVRGTLKEAGFSVETFERQQIPPTPGGEKFISDMCAFGYGDEQSLRTNEFIIRAFKTRNGI
jgi:2-polyprenyl-3-methyl-5-hydroxy-6-metoxy-1,4-benzoquinol methylase